MMSESRGLSRLAGIAAIALVPAVLAVLGSPQSAVSAGPACDTKLAVMGALTGPAGGLGSNIAHGINLAVAQYNNNHPGCDVQVVQFDTQGDPEQAQPIANTIVSDSSIIGVVGPAFSGESLATGSTFAQAGLPTISPSATNPVVAAQGWKTFHRVIANDVVGGPLLARYIVDKLRVTRVAVVVDNSTYGRTFARSVRVPLGRKVVYTASVRQGQRYFPGVVKSVKAKRAKVVVFGGYYPEAGRLARQLGKAGYTGVFLGGDGIMDPAFTRLAGTRMAGRSFISGGMAPPLRNTTFTSAYRAAFGVAPGLYSLESYDAVRVFLAGVNAGASTRSAMLYAVNHYNALGLTKQIAFSARGEVIRPPIWVYKPQGTGFAVRTRLQ